MMDCLAKIQRGENSEALDDYECKYILVSNADLRRYWLCVDCCGGCSDMLQL